MYVVYFIFIFFLHITATGKASYVEKIVYEAVDSSGNAARCTFRIELVRNEDHSRIHAKMHDKLAEQPDLTDNEAQKLEEQELQHHSPDKWHETVEAIKQADNEKKEQRRRFREERLKLRGGKKSPLHFSKTTVNDEASANQQLRNDIQGNKELRKKEKKGFDHVLWIVITPWNWPWPVFIPLGLFSLFGMFFFFGCGFGIYFLVEELSKPRGHRIPDHNSFWYKLMHWRNDKYKNIKQRV
ncbi:hypothetical protein RFI_11958 [Reticulomyxa filosa]|uniref:Uncharacterized protein n=1 Tax=Reticulomyxa filosa TaxID=46433 RepID=X6NGQ9_RETFI|nr:hypothetical protein RFI_11958 [Reticulomyxa filosa]|eukprot:ETO25181.1 hypothetical protein RFI_11958 [Reticulomyxa filosa]